MSTLRSASFPSSRAARVGTCQRRGTSSQSSTRYRAGRTVSANVCALHSLCRKTGHYATRVQRWAGVFEAVMFGYCYVGWTNIKIAFSAGHWDRDTRVVGEERHMD